MTINAYPLAWPAGWKRAASRKRAAFGKNTHYTPPGSTGGWNRKTELSVIDGVTRILGELGRMGIGRDDIVISTNVKVRLDGLPRSDGPTPQDPGVAVYWNDRGTQRCMAIDIYDRVADNLGAVAATIEAMRAIERHGGAEILNRAFTGFTALPAPGQTTTVRSWAEVMEFRPGEVVTAEKLQTRYRQLAAIRHPDKGGSDAAMAELNAARDQAQAALQ